MFHAAGPGPEVPGPEVTVRRLRRSDDAAVQALVDACGASVLDVLASGEQPRDALLVRLAVPLDADPESKRAWGVERAGRLVGLMEGLMHHPGPGECLIRAFALHPRVRGHGLATSAARFMLAQARHRGITSVEVLYRHTDLAQRSVLRSLGFLLDESPDEDRSDPSPPGFRSARLALR
ncbi:GNAT family N-acetyltransferase [Nakamurella flavida]|uniref:GNAT family N-acetyltransferase n=1 Tax=Nakamurella flavida TaxID=363630 RepID=A0A938YM07_9ACTN|nr:GNAT family N-acetyltransferase [Nakamurella flavida]MBM9477168.1 GNAT family N-acetyltransferase [Nakamurella flavida]MDP9780117.1 ribosomal protein S18 acetylase RimI-like enzyme [Nakamurella flavida]